MCVFMSVVHVLEKMGSYLYFDVKKCKSNIILLGFYLYS